MQVWTRFALLSSLSCLPLATEACGGSGAAMDAAPSADDSLATSVDGGGASSVDSGVPSIDGTSPDTGPSTPGTSACGWPTTPVLATTGTTGTPSTAAFGAGDVLVEWLVGGLAASNKNITRTQANGLTTTTVWSGDIAHSLVGA